MQRALCGCAWASIRRVCTDLLVVSQEKVGWPVMAAWAPRHLGGITGVCSLPSGTLVAAVVRRGGAQPALLGQFWGSIRRVQRVPAVTVRMLKVLERVVRGGWACSRGSAERCGCRGSPLVVGCLDEYGRGIGRCFVVASGEFMTSAAGLGRQPVACPCAKVCRPVGARSDEGLVISSRH